MKKGARMLGNLIVITVAIFSIVTTSITIKLLSEKIERLETKINSLIETSDNYAGE